jgi:hypothetical protein
MEDKMIILIGKLEEGGSLFKSNILIWLFILSKDDLTKRFTIINERSIALMKE